MDERLGKAKIDGPQTKILKKIQNKILKLKSHRKKKQKNILRLKCSVKKFRKYFKAKKF